jgi:hypothetical protein
VTLLDGCYSLKLECALRDLGFVEIGWSVVAHAGLFFVTPFSFSDNPAKDDDLYGFLLKRGKFKRIAPSAKRAFDVAFELSAG